MVFVGKKCFRVDRATLDTSVCRKDLRLLTKLIRSFSAGLGIRFGGFALLGVAMFDLSSFSSALE
ncbi:MAG: hypothetical protein IJ599_00725 [Alphaproteobacteria bacterium]|nr:hypothetical protein [Alphaproteobacteria bacterium]